MAQDTSESRLELIEQILAANAQQIAANTQAIQENTLGIQANTLGIQELRQSIAEEQRLVSDLRTTQAATDTKLDHLATLVERFIDAVLTSQRLQDEETRQLKQRQEEEIQRLRRQEEETQRLHQRQAESDQRFEILLQEIRFLNRRLDQNGSGT